MSDHHSGGITVHGTVAAGYEAVRDEFAAVLAEEPNEPGSQLAVYRNGRRVVDLWAGEGVDADSLPAVFSSTKGAAHLVVALLVQDGILDLDRTVASYWPEFAAEGKGALTLRELLGHRSGVIGVEGGFLLDELADDRVIAARLAGQAPFWEPGKEFGYHAFVIGALTGEVVRRVTGRSIQELFEERVRAPYGLDLYLGQPAELEPRYLPVRSMNPTPEQKAEFAARPFDPKGLQAVAFNVPTDTVAWINTPSVRALGPASVGGVGSARALAGMYAATLGEFAGRPPLLTAETRTEFARLSMAGIDRVTDEVDHFGLGFERPRMLYPSLGEGAFGHCGAAGSQAFADPSNGIAYGYTRRRFAFPGGAAPENVRLVAAVVEAANSSPSGD
ncbi:MULTISPECIES: serine hydrolase domain-containing protein [unclassified Streptomyces]|uniref:serine hydrolase domain-containing protein n=1 Tax=unclassified Streptomyces TaxID=2593676 RepID=UPI00224EA3C6|nr:MULTISPECIES: serine hydrolase domain-containing protein [unclassified Streptomyces]MCX5142027.1 beta-lactamase family protein [Streptomyces sp. NBC_00338]